MIFLKSIFAVVSILLVVGCSTTPDLTSFAEASKELKDGVNEVEQQVLSKVNMISESIDVGKKIGYVQTAKGKMNRWEVFPKDQAAEFKRSHKKFVTDLATINASMSIMVQYTGMLASLAANGETGAESSKIIINSTKSIFDTIGVAYSGSSTVSNGVINAFGLVAQLFTEIEAQNSLAETMISTQPAVDTLASLINKNIDELSKLMSGLTRLERQIILASYGASKMDYYHKFGSYKAIDNLYADMGQCTKKYKNDFEGLWNCHLTKEKAISYRLVTLQNIATEYEAYSAELAETRKWTKQQRQKLSAIKKAVQAWVSTHNQAANLLKKCGGMRSLHKSCGQLTVSNLKASIDWLKNIKEGFEIPEDNQTQ